MDYHWDSGKALSNLRTHHISFADAVTVFSDDHALTIEDDLPGECGSSPSAWTPWEEAW